MRCSLLTKHVWIERIECLCLEDQYLKYLETVKENWKRDAAYINKTQNLIYKRRQSQEDY